MARDEELVRHSFIIIERSGHPLNKFLGTQKNKFSVEVACQVGIGLLNCLEKLHSAGKVYNNICLENVLVAKVRDRDPRVTLINLEFCTDYLTKSGEHIKPHKVKKFLGNVEMASVNAMNLN